MKRSCHLHIEDETKQIKSESVMTNSFLSEMIEPNGYMKTSYVFKIHTYIHISTQNAVRRLCDNIVLYGTATSHGKWL